MNYNPITSMKTWLRLLLILITVGGGFTGVVLSLQLVGEAKDQGAFQVVVALAFVGMYAFVTGSGLLLAHDPKRTRPVLVSLALQLPWVSCPVFVYEFAAGMHAAFTLGTPDDSDRIGLHLGWNLLVGSHCLFRFADYQEVPWTFGVNLVPLILMTLMLRSSTSLDAKPHDEKKASMSVVV